MQIYPIKPLTRKPAGYGRLNPLLRMLKPLLCAAAAGLAATTAHAGTCNVTTPGAATCSIPVYATSVNVVATGAGGGGGGVSGGSGGAGGIVTATLTGVGGTTLNLFVGGGGITGSFGGSGGGSSNVNAGTASQIVAGGGGGGSGGSGGSGGNGNGGNASFGGVAGIAGQGGAGGVGGLAGSSGVNGGNGNGGGGGGGGYTGGTIGGGAGIGGGVGVEDFRFVNVITYGFGGGGGGGFGGGGGGGFAFGIMGAGGGGGSTGGTITVASNGGAPGSNGGAGSIVITWTDPVTAPVDPIPPLAGVPAVPGIGIQPAVLDLGASQGPTMTICLRDTVRSLFGADAVFAGQSANGVARFSQGGRVVAFYPLQASTNAGLGASINLTGSNMLTVGTSCGIFNIAPALANLTEFGAVLAGLGLQANIAAQGAYTLTAGSTVYVFRPDYLATSGGTPGVPSLTQGSDGLYRFKDSAGNMQILYPAFVDVDALAGQVPLALAKVGTVSIQTDGTALFTAIGGQQFVLTPDLTLTPAPSANATMLSWQDKPNHYFVRGSTLTMAQGFTVRQR